MFVSAMPVEVEFQHSVEKQRAFRNAVTLYVNKTFSGDLQIKN